MKVKCDLKEEKQNENKGVAFFTASNQIKYIKQFITETTRTYGLVDHFLSPFCFWTLGSARWS